MATDPKNTVNLTGGVVSDFEVLTPKNGLKIYKFRLAVDRAGQFNGTNDTGYFDVTYFANDTDPSSNFINSQVENGNLKKGSQIQISGRLVHDRWDRDDKKGSKVTIIAEGITYSGSRSKDGNTSKESDETPTNSSAAMPSSW